MGIPFRFIHAADLHIDSPFRGFSEAPPHVREALLSSTFRAVSRLADLAVASNADFVVIAGDLYDAADRSLRAQLALQREWERLGAHGVRLYIIHGNHDHLGGGRANLSLPGTVYTFGSERVECVPAYRKDGSLAAYIYGISYGDRAVTDNLAARYKPKPDGPYHIALLHGNVGGDAGHDPYAPCSVAELAGSGFDYWALGHIHTRSVLHEYPHIVYSGNIQGRHSRENGAKGCYIVDVSASKETKLTFVPLDAVRWENVRVSIEGMDSEQSLLDGMEEAVRRLEDSGESRPFMVRIRLEGRGPMHLRLADPVFSQDLLEGLRARLDDGHNGSAGVEEGVSWRWVYDLEQGTGSTLDWDALAEEDSFIGEMARVSAAIETDRNAVAELVEEALSPLTASPKLRRLMRSLPEETLLTWFRQARELAAGLMADENGYAAGMQDAAKGENRK
jgi:DNA repair exonuclease SbcCD nuclease subunit